MGEAPDGWERRRLRAADISYGHTPDQRGERTDRWAKEPIVVRQGFWGGWKVQDGNDRLFYARQRGDTYIEAYVPAPKAAPASTPKAKRKNLGFGLYWA